MLHRLSDYITEHTLFNFSDSVLVAVSGGIDSMCLLHSLRKLNINIGVAHCNFHLRGHESDADEAFVRHYCQQFQIPLYVKSYDTDTYSKQQRISVQEAARELRYSWFDELMNTHNYRAVAVAHNKDDVVETILLNLARGTGLKGLTGIKPKLNYVVRPFLFASRHEIVEYVSNEQIPFREDSSNAETKYARNKLRHEIIPKFREINPKFTENVLNASEILNDIDIHLEKDMELFRSAYVSKQHQMTIIDHRNFMQAPFWMKYTFLKDYGFHANQINNITRSVMQEKPGNLFLSDEYELLVDRQQCVIRKIQPKEHAVIHLHENQYVLNHPIHLSWEILDRNKNFSVSSAPHIAMVDYNTITFPLKIRKWKKKDSFHPLGMHNSKKLSDFFIDRKISRFEKENIWLLTNQQDQIIWIINYRIDDRFKITSRTNQVLKMEYHNR
ncbi:MAG: tRNA lysidine(34) synthetase TilS [Bacteroidetes bacterium]|jgi:tRNA(Ile)-lysidine synthase|nr:tRNA lysidine(34) synthetase TilS [Bacteroidota bacterium]